MKIAINGFGRIGRAVFRIAQEQKLNIVAINDLHGAEDACYLLQHDSIYGRFPTKINTQNDYIIVNNKKTKVLSEKDPSKLPWKKLGVDIVVESTGIFCDRDGASLHLKAGAKYVLITAPIKGEKNPDVTIVPGVNHSQLKKEHKIISVASCTTNCLTPVLKVLHENFIINRALVTTIHAYTNDQVLHDQFHKKRRRGRAGALNMIPTSTGAAEAVAAVLPELTGKVNGLAVRVPVSVGSLVDLVAVIEKPADADKINASFKKASEKQLKGILEYSEEDLVSSDVIKNTHSALFDAKSTQVEDNLVKVLAWYDNEWGYSCRVIDVIKILNKW